jgi:hypothetical protein
MMKGPNFQFKHEISPEDPKSHYLTESKAKFVDATIEKGRTEAAASLLTYNRQAHFSFGSQGQSLISSKQLCYGAPGEGEPAKLDVEKLIDLKREHFRLGDCKDKIVSVNKEQYKWIQPVNHANKNA